MTRFMTLDFADGDRSVLLGRVTEMARGPYVYVVTPNVDHVIKLMDGRVGADVYQGADLKICDSRILSHLARLKGRRLSVYPGSDMTADLLALEAGRELTIAVFGPDRGAFDDLVARYPQARLVCLDAPMLVPDAPAWDAAVRAAALNQERPLIPRHWDLSLQELLRSAWADEPRARPSFAAVLEILENVYKSIFKMSSEEAMRRGDKEPDGCNCTLM